MSVKEVNDTEVAPEFAALISNVGAVRAITEAVQGTLGPKGLDCMLVDQYGGVIITNDGVTILKTMDVNHPAARIVISAAEHQEAQVGDGTTTATIIAGALVVEGANQVLKGVPVIKVIEGIKLGIAKALELLAESVVSVADLDSGVLEQIALVAGRGHRDLAGLVTQAARILGIERLRQPGFRLADQVIAIEGATSGLIRGTLIDREPLNKAMPRQVTNARILILDDALEPFPFNSEAMSTEAGFNRQAQSEQELLQNLHKLADLGVKAVFTDRGISDQAEELLTDLNIIGVQSVVMHQWRRLAELSGARPLKRASLAKPPAELAGLTGEVAAIQVDETYKQLKVLSKPDQKYITILVGAYTKEVVGERERIAKDAAAAVQAAWQAGVVPGGGSVELGIARRLELEPLRGMTSYGYNCVVEALKRPMTQICLNAGFNPLEKIEAVLARQTDEDSDRIGVNCDDGSLADLAAMGIWDPYWVKYYAILSASEVCEAILRINTIIKMREEAVQ